MSPSPWTRRLGDDAILITNDALRYWIHYISRYSSKKIRAVRKDSNIDKTVTVYFMIRSSWCWSSFELNTTLTNSTSVAVYHCSLKTPKLRYEKTVQLPNKLKNDHVSKWFLEYLCRKVKNRIGVLHALFLTHFLTRTKLNLRLN